MDPALTDAQLAILGKHVRLVEACPGAGKTRAIVSRFIAATTSSDRAVALISFTNAAVDEAVRRCANEPQATQAPNFIGTFDRFIHRYIVTPVVIRENGKRPRYVDSWSDLPASFVTQLRRNGVAGSGLGLASFRADINCNLHYPDDAPQADRAYLAQLAQVGLSPPDLVGQAEAMIGGLLDADIYDSEFARLKCLTILQDDEYGWLHNRLGERFEEVIVDEFQDCSAIEHEILRRLVDLGIRVVVVADPDQAIYEFRQAAPASYVNYRDALPSEHVVYLDENWRSSPAICTLLTSLRSISSRHIESRRDGQESPHADAVYVAAGTPAFARETFDRLASELNIPGSERVALAATRSAARTLSGSAPSISAATKNSSKVIRLIAVLRFSHDASERKMAITGLESILMGTIKFTDAQKKGSREEQLEAAGIDQAQLRMMVGQLVDASSMWSSAESAVASIKESVSQCLFGVGLGHTAMGLRFRSATSSDWRAWERAEGSVGEQGGLAGAHIHSVKGGERDAVLLDIEDAPIGSRAHVVELWASSQTHEARRVLYVGASRARRLLVLAVSPVNLAALEEVLANANVIVEYISEGGSN